MEGVLLEDYINNLYRIVQEADEQQAAEQPAEEQPAEEQPAEKQPELLPGIKALNREQLKYILKNSKGKIMTIAYRKKDGTLRTINTRTGVKKDITGKGLTYNPDEYGYVILWDLNKKAYRTVNLDTVTTLKGGGEIYKIQETLDRKPLVFKTNTKNLVGEDAWKQWWWIAMNNRTNDYVKKVLNTIKDQKYFVTPRQYQILVNWFNGKR
jgi:hypothetical protein